MDLGLRRLLQFEGAAEAGVGAAIYLALGEGWLLFLVAAALPDLSMAGYLAGPRMGALIYNAAHTTIMPFALAIIAIATGPFWLAAVAAAWLVHIGVDRALGYGLKSSSGFRFTHLGTIGRTDKS